MRVLSGIQPSGDLHLGNYFGMMKKMIMYQETSELFAFIANMHAMTSVFDGKALANGTMEAAVNFLALGLDPEKAIFWVQSDVPEVAEVAPEIATQFAESATQISEGPAGVPKATDVAKVSEVATEVATQLTESAAQISERPARILSIVWRTRTCCSGRISSSRERPNPSSAWW